METKPSAKVVRFGVFELDPGSGELRRNGLKIRLPEQSFQVLRLLLSRPGEIVTRDELRHALWTSDTYVDFDGGLNSAVRKLREALDDSAENPRFVVTLPRRGYRFVAPIEVLATNQPAGAVVAAPAHEAAHPQRSLIGGLLVAGAVAIVGVGHGDPSATRRSQTAGRSSVMAAGPRANPGVNEKAYAAYLNGVAAMGLQKADGFARAVAYFEEAVKLQPDFAEGHAVLSLSQLQLLFGGRLSPREVVPKAEAAARRALELDETAAQAHRVLGQILNSVLLGPGTGGAGASARRRTGRRGRAASSTHSRAAHRIRQSGRKHSPGGGSAEPRPAFLSGPDERRRGVPSGGSARSRDHRVPPCTGDGARAAAGALRDRRDLCRHGSNGRGDPRARSLGVQ